MNRDRARVHLPDMFVLMAMFAGAVAVAPVIIDLSSGMTADPMTGLLMGSLPVVLFVAIVISIGVSAVRDD